MEYRRAIVEMCKLLWSISGYIAILPIVTGVMWRARGKACGDSSAVKEGLKNIVLGFVIFSFFGTLYYLAAAYLV